MAEDNNAKSVVDEAGAEPIVSAALFSRMVPLHDHVEVQVALACYTSTLLVAANAIVVGAGASVASQLAVLSKATGFQRTLLLSGFLLVTAALLLALWSVFPNLRVIAFRKRVRNIFFFGKIGKGSYEDFLRDAQAVDADGTLQDEVLHQVYGKSRWLRKMFRMIQGSVILTLAGTLTLVVAIVLVVTRAAG